MSQLQDLIMNAYRKDSMEQLRAALERRMMDQEYAVDQGYGASNQMGRPSLVEDFAKSLGQELPPSKMTIQGLFQNEERPPEFGGHGFFKSIFDVIK